MAAPAAFMALIQAGCLEPVRTAPGGSSRQRSCLVLTSRGLVSSRDVLRRWYVGPADLVRSLPRWLTAWPYALRALAATVLPGHSAERYRRHVAATLHPGRGEGLGEAAERYNRSA